MMFKAEARIMARLDHPNIPKLFDVGTYNGAPFLAMEHLRGISLSTMLSGLSQSKRRLSVHQVISLGIEVCRALMHAQARIPGIIHRDISPQNIFLTTSGRIMLLDFGVAHDGLGNTAPHQVKGKAAYMSPEQVKGAQLDARSDIFSLSIVLWEALTGRRLFYKKDLGGCLRAILRAEVPALSKLRPQVPKALSELIHRGLAKRRENRPPSVAVLYRALRALRKTKVQNRPVPLEEGPTKLVEVPLALTKPVKAVKAVKAVRPPHHGRAAYIEAFALIFLSGVAGGIFLVGLLLQAA